MNEKLHCPNGHEVAPTDKICPICHTLLPNLRLDLPSQPLLPSVPGYDIVRVLGSGGMGIVYEARQKKVHDRPVALKMIRALQLLDAEEMKLALTRFRMEAAAVAELNHPNIVQIYDVGEHEGYPYLAMEFVEGGNLDQKLAGQPQQPVFAAELVGTLARAIHVAHQKGIVHRDLKPLNVLLTAEGVAKITDFGLAKRLGTSGATETGQVLGSAPYMSPEQARGKPDQIGAATDIYALGVILYEILTGRPPFLGKDVMEILTAVVVQDPVPPQRLGVDVPADLETICLKCLEKEPGKRYASAADLAEDLRRFLAHEPIVARPVGPLERILKFAKRRPAVAALIGVSTIAPLVLLLVVLVYNAYLSQALTDAKQRKKEADDNAFTAKQNEDQANKNARESQRRLARQFLGNGARALERDDLFGAFVWFAEARGLEEADPVADVLHRTRLSSILRQCPKLTKLWRHDGDVLHAEFSPDGKYVVTASDDHTARIWDVETGAEVSRKPLRHQGQVAHAAFSPDGKRVVTASHDGSTRVWDALSGDPLTEPMTYLGGMVTYAAFSPDGKRIVTAGGPKWDSPWVRSKSAAPLAPPGPNDDRSAVRVWDASTGKPITAPIDHIGFVHHAAFNADGKRLVTAGGDGIARVWDAATGKPLSDPLKHDYPVFHAVFAPNGNILTACGDSFTGLAQLWGPGEPSPVPFLDDKINGGGGGMKPQFYMKHDALVFRAIFSPNGKVILTASADRTARLWDAHSGSPLLAPLEHEDMVKDVAFSPDGLRVATASGDPQQGAGVARVWDVVTGQPVTPALGHGAARHAYFVHRVRFSPDGSHLVTASDDHMARVWELASGAPHVFSVATRSTGLFPRGPVVAPGKNAARDPFRPSGARPRDLPDHPNVQQVQLSPEGRRAVVVDSAGIAQVWDTVTGAPLTPYLRISGKIRHVAVSLDGKRVVTAGTGKPAPAKDGKLNLLPIVRGEVRVWDALTGQPLSGLLEHDLAVQYAAFSADGEYVVTVCHNENWDLVGITKGPDVSEVRVWKVKGSHLTGGVLKHEGKVHYAAFSPDGNRLVTAGSDQSARVWAVFTGKAGSQAQALVEYGRQITQVKHKGRIFFAAFSPDGNRLITAGEDEAAEVWDAATGKRLTPPLRHQFAVTFAAFSPDGRRVVTASRDDTARVWDADTGAPVTPPLRHSGAVHHAAFTVDGRLLATAATYRASGGAARGGAELLTERRHDGVRTLVNVPATHEGDGEARVWDAATGEPITPALLHRFPVNQVMFFGPTVVSQLLGEPGSPALRTSAQSSGGASEVRLWDLLGDPRPAEVLQRLGQVFACRRLDPSRELSPIEAADLRTEWQTLRTVHPGDFTCSQQERLTWHRTMADACEQSERWAEAVTHLDQLIAAEPGQWYLYFRRAEMRDRLSQWKEALADCSKAIELKMDYGPIWGERGYVHSGLERWHETISDYSQAVKLDAADRSSWHGRGYAHGVLKNFPEALKDYSQAVKILLEAPERSALDTVEIEIWAGRALLRLHLGDRAGYRADCAAMLGLFGAATEPEAARELVRTCTLAPDAVADLKPLVDLAAKTAEAHPNKCPFHHAYGAMLYRAGRIDDAAATLRRAMVIHGKSDEVPGEEGSPRDWIFLAMIHHRQGKTEEATKWLAKAARALDPAVRLDWQDRLEFQMLYREAETLLGKKK